MLAKKTMNLHYKFILTSILTIFTINTTIAEDISDLENTNFTDEEYINLIEDKKEEELSLEDRDRIIQELKEKEILFEINFLMGRENLKIEPYIQETPLEDSYFFIANSESYIYNRKERLFIKAEEIIDIRNQTIVRSEIQNRINKDLIKEYKENNQVIEFKREENKNNVFVFFDKTCDYCAVIKSRSETYLNAGINITLVPYPRNGLDGTPYLETLKYWCQEVPHNCNLNVRRGYSLGQNIKITGTPTFIDEESGKVLSGFRTPKTLIDMFGYK